MPAIAPVQLAAHVVAVAFLGDRAVFATADGGVTVVPIPDEIGRLAVEAFGRFGKGRGGKAQLNLGDCLSYATARAHAARILFKGDDFVHTDLKSALAP